MKKYIFKPHFVARRHIRQNGPGQNTDFRLSISEESRTQHVNMNWPDAAAKRLGACDRSVQQVTLMY